MSDKPKPLKVFGRSHYACTRCKMSKIKCSGEKPACANCKAVGKENQCVYPTRDRKIVIMESDLNKLHEKVRLLESLVRSQPPSSPESLNACGVSSNSMIQQRIIDDGSSILESYLVPNSENEYIPHELLILCRHLLPDQVYAWLLIDILLQTYSTEFYLIDTDVIQPLVSQIYSWLTHPNFESISPKHRLPPMALCYFFALLAFGEQLRNSTLEIFPTSTVAAADESKKIPGTEFYSAASKLFTLVHEEVSVQFIQCAVVIGLFACNLNRYNTVNNFFGVAVRSAVAGGYHRKLAPSPDMDEEQRRRHLVFESKTNRLWWTIFVIDVIWTAKMNMPIYIDYTDTDVALPLEMAVTDFGDGFNSSILQYNVELCKHVAKFNKIIYGPSIRTFTMNYINTEQFNQKTLVKNIITSLKDIHDTFEISTLGPLKNVDLIAPADRNVANLFLRYNQVLILVTKPLLSLVFNRANASHIENSKEVLEALARASSAAAVSLDILFHFYEQNKLFVLGFWDSQHLFSALLILIMTTVLGFPYKHLDKAGTLLKHMAESRNINAVNSMEKLQRVNGHLCNIPELSLRINLDGNITDYFVRHSPSMETSPKMHTNGKLKFYNPYVEADIDAPDFSAAINSVSSTASLYDYLNLSSMKQSSQAALCAMIATIQSWEAYRGLPLQVYGTGGVSINHPRTVAKGNFKIEELI